MTNVLKGLAAARAMAKQEVRDVQPPDRHDFRRIRCAPEGHFFVGGGNPMCDCGARTAIISIIR